MMSDKIFYYLQNFHKLYKIIINRRISSEKINLSGYARFLILFILDQFGDGLSLTELHERINYDKGTITRAVNELQKKGYIVKKRNTADKRALKIKLTQKGIKFNKNEKLFRKKFFNRITNDLKEHEIASFEYALKHITKNTEQFIKEIDKNV